MLPTMKQHFLFPFQRRSWNQPWQTLTQAHAGPLRGSGVEGALPPAVVRGGGWAGERLE